ncbi:MAG: phosphatidate cytidylyltransferase [Crocinitomicaceae bacterium]|nr:phosphatidate cytidylyltransferase [Crocinitomicaceae bacterium]
MNNVLLRSLTGAVFITVVLFPLFWKDEAATTVFGAFMVLGLIEFFKLFKKSDSIHPSYEIGLVLGLLIFGLSTFIAYGYLSNIFYLTVVPLVFLGVLAEIWRKKENPLINVGVTVLGIVYVTVPFVLMALFNLENQTSLHQHNSFPLLAGMFILIWMNDTFAYLSGRFFGKTKLIERISPNKTWEGTIGGVIFTIAAGFAIGLIFDDQHITFWVISAIIIAPCAAVGDLLESLFKRNMGVKDSGNILPGHGGILDRFDATLFTAPFFIAWTFIYMYF